MDKVIKKYENIILQCFNAAIEGPFFPEWEFHTLMGFTRKEINLIYLNFKEKHIIDENFKIALSNLLGNLLYYPHNQSQKIWDKYIHMSKKELEALVNQIKEL
jgi:hypothetical protein